MPLFQFAVSRSPRVYFEVWQLILEFYSPFWKQMVQLFSFCPWTAFTSNIFVALNKSEFCKPSNENVSSLLVGRHQEVTMYTIGTCCTSYLTVGGTGWNETSFIPTSPSDSQLRSTTRTSCCIIAAYIHCYLLMMGN
jgi:hypothetical protein